MMTFRELFQTIGIRCDNDEIVRGISDDSRVVGANWLFVSITGMKDSGEHYIEEVLNKGAYVLSKVEHHHPRIFTHPHPHFAAATLLDIYYDYPYRHLYMIGVTGTSGKSSVTLLAAQLFERSQVMVIGTDGIQYDGHQVMSGNTTPSLFVLMKALSDAVDKDIVYVLMEVSSHAIAMHRIGNILFDTIIYTRITSDHLDYHLTMSQYRYTKFKLRNALKSDGVIILHNDDETMRELYDLSDHPIITYGLYGAHYTAEAVSLSDHSSRFRVHDYTFYTSLLSVANVLNCCVVIALGRLLGFRYPQLQEAIYAMHGIAGRLECIKTPTYTIWIDYAHTSDALRNLLQFAREVTQARVICVVGCGGERDRSKRPIMAKLSNQYSDLSIFTTDNPRHEDISQILADMDVYPSENTMIFEDRRCAIKHAVKNANNGDIIIVAGRGNEMVQSIYGQRIPFHDHSVIKEILLREEVPWISNI